MDILMIGLIHKCNENMDFVDQMTAIERVESGAIFTTF